MLKSVFFISAPIGLVFLVKKLKPLDIVLNKIADKIYRNHPSIAGRLQPIIGTSFLIEITDLPFNILLAVEQDALSIKCHRSNNNNATLHISGKFLDLVSIFEGDEDGDALFFSRRLRITGNTEPLVCLRNAIDSEEINIINEISTLFGVFSKPSEKLISFAMGKVGRIMKKVHV